MGGLPVAGLRVHFVHFQGIEDCILRELGGAQLFTTFLP
jgi:hypothetical protein